MNHEFCQVEDFLCQYQRALISLFEHEDGKASFLHDDWSYHGQGGGKTCILRQGDVFESAGVNFSSISGDQLPKAATDKRPELSGCPFKATGVSVVIHPQNPMVPTCHANFRFMLVTTPKGPMWWFGGGFDLTPYYGFDEDCVSWHQAAHQACAPYGDELYGQYKQWCDDYFYLPHRHEPRGIGGLFFDDLNAWGYEKCFAFIQSCAQAFQKAYGDIVIKRKTMAYTDAHKAFQKMRRGRYVEFNLLYDRGTLFGLQSKGRVESILMSMPPQVTWAYDWKPKSGSEEAKLIEYYLKPKDWLKLKEPAMP
jgi:coproporphyrinogen III oxidase